MLFYALLALGGALILAGIVGCVLPIVPGPPLSWLGLFALWAGRGFPSHPYGTLTIAATGAAMVAVTVFDFVAPAFGARRYGGGKLGVWGSVVGMVVGIIWFPPFGMVVGAFVGALVGEIVAGKESGQAARAAFGVFIGTVAATAAKLAVSGVIAWFFVVSALAH